jgi:hypothetical protein
MAVSLELAISAIRSGRKDEGRQLLNLLIQRNPNDDKAWLWMSSVVDTDEQRARCLYHVLAITPGSDLARRGLQLLGIVVSDSRPVKVPRDSQPIKIPRPSLKPRPQFPFDVQTAEAESEPSEERRPFRIDPKSIVEELPFTPISQPFSQSLDDTVGADTPAPTARPGSQPVSTQQPSEPAPVVQPNAQGYPQLPAGQPQGATQPLQIPSEPVAPVGQPQQHPSEPAPVVQPGSGVGGGQQQPAQLQAGGPINSQDQAQYPHPALPAYQQQPYPGAGIPHETRPSQPVPVIHSHTTMGMPMQPAPYNGGPYAYQYPSAPAQAVHSSMTMGMPTQHFQPYYPSQSGQAIHSNSTMGMPMVPQHSDQVNNNMPPPSEPGPAGYNQMPGMPMQAQGQYQAGLPYNAAVHSNATMSMPAGHDPMAALRAAAMQNNQGGQPTQSGSRNNKSVETDDEEVNILAVIIFGSLSITALGGLGMLILLMFTAG